MFGLWICWLGIGSGMMALALRRGRLSVLWSPLLAAVVSVVSFVFLFLSATPESIHDIVGTPVWTQDHWQAVPAVPRLALQAIHRYPAAVNVVEMCGRYMALYAPIPILVSLAVILLTDRAYQTQPLPARLPLMVMSIGLLWVCKLIVIDYANTTNIVELIAYPATFGIPGMVWNYLALGLLAIGAALAWAALTRQISPRIGLVLNVLLIPLGFLAVQQGLDQDVEKFGHRFSALQFLLLGNRTGDASNLGLILVWAGIQFIFCLVVALGLRLLLPRWRSTGVPAA
jgi:hypothetical protein